jgi:hypothetical protein
MLSNKKPLQKMERPYKYNFYFTILLRQTGVRRGLPSAVQTLL